MKSDVFMCNITLIATVHNGRGLCNSSELYKIIESIAPDTIFEELSTVGFAAIYSGQRADTLETTTIKSYLQKYPISHFPVDLDGNELVNIRFKNDIIEMFDVFDNTKEYRLLSSERDILAERLGFPYLNSERYRNLLERKHFLEGSILRMMNNEELFQTYKGWVDINDRREDGMVSNIYKYSALNPYSRGLFFIGAEHRKSVMDKILKFEMSNEFKLNWTFDYFD
jgi:hypothetical protein